MSFSSLLARVDGLALGILGEEEPVTYTPSVGAAVAVSGIFDETYVLVDVGGGSGGASGTAPAVFLRLEDLSSDPLTDDARITRGGVQYKIREAKPDGQGMVLLLLQRA